MSVKRKDSKGRVLRNGESQRADGRYMFRYTDSWGERQSVYSWKLVETDKVPEGKKCDKSLREMEKQIQRDLDDKIKTKDANSITIDDAFWSFMRDRKDLRETTRCNYITLYNRYIKPELGDRRVGTVKHSDIQRFYFGMLTDKGYSYGTTKTLQGILYQLLEAAVKDNIIRINPADGALRKVRRATNAEQAKRHALTEEEQARFIDFVYDSSIYKRWGPLFTVLLGSGLRISEALGLRWCDCDFDEGIIKIDHALIYRPREEDLGYEFRITETKTVTGRRIVPMFNDVKKALIAEREKPRKNQREVDGYTDFVFLNNRGNTISAAAMYSVIHRIVDAYNKQEGLQAEQEKREPCFLPYFSSHNLRHTFCTRMCENEPNLKIIQEIMGHKSITTTMDVYNEATETKKLASIKNLEGKFKLA